MWDRLVFGQPNWLWGIVAVGCLVLILLWFSYRNAQLSFGLKFLAFTLKSIAIALALICLLEPLVARQRPRPQSNFVAVLLDNSQSMQAMLGADQTLSTIAGKTAADQWNAVIASDAHWQQRIIEDFRLRRYRFGNRLEAVNDLASLDLTDNQTSLHRSLVLLSERFRDRPLAGVVLVSDGQATDLSGSSPNWAGLGFPVYPIRLEMPQGTKDLRVSGLTMRQSDFEAAPVTMIASIQSRGYKGRSASIELVDAQKAVVLTQTLKLEGDSATQTVEFRFRPEESGVQGYQVRTALVENAKSTLSSPDVDQAAELTLLNNFRSQVVDRGRGPYRILYVAGRPNWEHKFLRRALQEDDEIQLVSLIRIAKKEPKFSFRDSKIDSANPLFSGFEDISEEEKEQFNEPVFVRLGVSDTTQLQGGFPKTADELFSYQAVVLDDLELEFFTADQQALLRQFVSFRGGGLLFLGGQESMRGKGFRESVLSQLLPVYGEARVSPSENMNAKSSPPTFQFDLTREGWLQPFLRTSDTEPAQRKSLAAMPSLQVLNESGGVKPGAVVLANAMIDEASIAPALVTQRFGNGRTAVLLIGDMWRWGLHHEQANQAPLFQAWRQMIRWLIADVPRSITMRAEQASETAGGHTAKVLIEVLSLNFQSMDNVDVQVVLTKPDGSELNGKAEPSARQSGLYELPVMTIDEGVYKALATVTAADGSVVGTGQVGWVHEPSATELQTLGSNSTVLNEIAEQTGGKVVDVGNLDDLSLQLADRPAPISETKVEPLWHSSWVLGLILVCLSGEWWIRRKNGLR